MKFDFNETKDVKVYTDTQKAVATAIAKADNFKKNYDKVREEMFKNLSKNGVMVYLDVLMCEGELVNTPETLVYSNGTPGFQEFRDNLKAAMSNLGKFRVYSAATHNILKAIPQRVRDFISKKATRMPTGIFLPQVYHDTIKAILYGTDDEKLLESMVRYRKGTQAHVDYTERYRKGVIKCYRDEAQKYVDNFDQETKDAMSKLYESLASSYKMYAHKEGQLTEAEVLLIQEEVNKAFGRHPLKDLTAEGKMERFQIIYHEYPVPPLDYAPVADTVINEASAEYLKKMQEECKKLKELMVVDTVKLFYDQIKKHLDKLSSKMAKDVGIDKDAENFLEALLDTIQELQVTLGDNPQLIDMEQALKGCIKKVEVPAVSIFAEPTVKKIINEGSLKAAIEKYGQEVASIVDEAGTKKFANTMKALKF